MRFRVLTWTEYITIIALNVCLEMRHLLPERSLTQLNNNKILSPAFIRSL